MKKITVILLATVLFLSCKKDLSTIQKQINQDSVEMFKTTPIASGIQVAECSAGAYSNILRIPNSSIYTRLNYGYDGHNLTYASLDNWSSPSGTSYINNTVSWGSDYMSAQMMGWIFVQAGGGHYYDRGLDWHINPATCMLVYDWIVP